MKRLGSSPDRLVALLTRLRPLLELATAAAASAGRRLAERFYAVDWRALWQRLREDRRPVLQKLKAALDGVLSSPRIQPIRERLWKAWTWAVLHDTVPREATARRREWSMARQQRHEMRDAERHQRQEEQAKKRVKKGEEDRQAYSVYVE